MAEDGEIDIEGDFEFKLESNSDVYDTNELPSKSANLLPEYTNPAWMLEQGWTMDSFIDEKSKATIEKMLQEEQYYMNGKGGSRFCKSPRSSRSKPQSHKRPWNDDERRIFEKGLEIYGRSWSKIAELIPTRTALQVKNFAQQYFKTKTKPGDHITDPPTTQVKQLGMTQSPLCEVLASVTTAQPTIPTVSQSVSTSQISKSALMAHLTMPQHKNNVNSGKPEVTDDSKTMLPQKMNILVEPNVTKKIENFLTIHQKQNTPKPATVSKPNPLSVTTVSKPLNKVVAKGKKEVKSVKPKSDKLVNQNKKKVPDESVGSKALQLSPTLEDKLASSTGIIENLDGFCAVADIVIGTEKDGDDDEEIDIENDEDNDENPVLKCRSASPNSVYEKLWKSATMNRRRSENKNAVVVYNGRRSDQISEDQKPVNSDPVISNLSSVKDSPNKFTEEEEEHRSKSPTESESRVGENYSLPSDKTTEIMQINERKISNAVVLFNGDTVEFDIPTEEQHMDLNTITEQERKIHAEFFDGRASKTPERYLKIRNFILQSWRKCKPNYLNKTSVRPGLKNCGDVNCIGRIHAFLECTGAINFGCDQACYRQPAKIGHVGTKEKVVRDIIAQLPNNLNLEFMRSRKRRIRDEDGQWVDERDLQGKTIEHVENPKDEATPNKVKPSKSGRTFYDPFKLIPCQPFTEQIKPPFGVEILNSAVVTMDLHAHISKTEVIGMLGGHYHEDIHMLEITMAVPCNSLSTGMQCEIDPVSQSNACEEITHNGFSLIGWYHSHPTFSPNPSIIDIETQLKFQDWFSKGGCTFVGVIVSPYNRLNTTCRSEVQCLTISQEKSDINKCNIPYFFDFKTVIKNVDLDTLTNTAQLLADKYCQYSNRVELLAIFRMSSGMTCLDKMLNSVKESLNPESPETDVTLESIREIFTSTFSKHFTDIIDPDIIDQEESSCQTEEDSVSMYSSTDTGDSESVQTCVSDDKTDVTCTQSNVLENTAGMNFPSLISIATKGSHVDTISLPSRDLENRIFDGKTNISVLSSVETETGSKMLDTTVDKNITSTLEVSTGSRITASKADIKSTSPVAKETKILQNGIQKTFINETV